jgi:signal transduction histidine kinase
MSHELRTPMNAIIGYNALLLDEIYGPLPRRAGERRAARGSRAAAHLLELLNDVLDLAKIEAGRIELQEEPVRIPALLRELADTVRPLAETARLRAVNVEGAGRGRTRHDGPAARAPDPAEPALQRGEVRRGAAGAARLGAGARRRRAHPVVDQGRGIDPADQERIFEEFVQVDSPEGTGTGLGLPISQRLAQLLGGRLELRSALGSGSEFRLTLPPALPASGPARSP